MGTACSYARAATGGKPVRDNVLVSALMTVQATWVEDMRGIVSSVWMASGDAAKEEEL